jgi:hypothetical protein
MALFGCSFNQHALAGGELYAERSEARPSAW